MQQGKILKEQPASNTPKSGNRSSLLLIAASILLMGVALFAATRFVGVLYAMIFPAEPPLPSNSVVLEHTSQAHGVDEWLYSTSTQACEVARFYQSRGECAFAPGMCKGALMQDDTVIAQGENVAQCSGEVDFSIFAMRWRSTVAGGYRDGDPTRFRLWREVFWTGQVPQPMPE